MRSGSLYALFYGDCFLGQSKTDCTESQAYSRSSECNCRQDLPSGLGHSNRMVLPTGAQSDLSGVTLSKGGPFCNQIQQQTT